MGTETGGIKLIEVKGAEKVHLLEHISEHTTALWYVVVVQILYVGPRWTPRGGV